MLKNWSWLLVALVAPMAVGCGSSEGQEAPAAGEEVGVESDDLTDKGANGWQHQALDFTCDVGVSNKVSWSSRRHFYSFPGQAGVEATFTLSGSWPAHLGARLYVTDVQGNILAWGKEIWKSSTSAKVKFPSTGKYFVFAAPYRYTQVYNSHAYKLAASCSSACASDADCEAGSRCVAVVCKGLGCKPKNVCVEQPLCAEYTTSDGRFYAKNFPAGAVAEAQAWLVSDPQVKESGWGVGTCPEHNAKACDPSDPPVCGTPISTDTAATYAGICEFRKVIREAAGAEGESKGKFSEGACGASHCAVATAPWGTFGTYYAQNVASQAEADAFFAGFPEGTETGLLAGACDQGWACPAVYNPVCGVIKSNPAQTFSNGCAFAAAVRADAGSASGSGSKGFVQSEGECGPACDYSNPTRHYVVQSAELCKAAKFACQAGQEHFFDACGCGCVDVCETSACGPALGLPSQICDDGSFSGPTGRCLKNADGTCGWEVASCP